MRQGIIVLFDPNAKWGFVKESDGTEWFFHQNNSPGFKAFLGAPVEYIIIPPRRLGLPDQAANLRLADGGAE